MAGRFSVHALFKLTDKMSGPIAKIEGRMSKFARNASHSLEKLDGKMGKIGSGMKHAGVAMLAGGASAAAGIASVVKPALELETAMAKVSTVITPAMGTVQEAMEKTKKAALDWSNQHTQSAEQFLEASYNMSSAGLDSEQALAGTTAALTLATATLGDAATAGNLLATVYNNMGNKSGDAGVEMMRLADVLAKTQAVFQIADLSQLNESLKMGAPAAIQYGISVEQLSNAVGSLNTAGLQGGMAGTSFAASMRNMQKASKALKFEIAKTETGGVDFAGTLGNIAKKYGSFEKMTDKQKLAFQQAFGDEGLRAISLLLGKTELFDKNLEAITGKTGAAAEQQRKIEQARGAALDVLGNQIHNVAGEFGEALLPALDKLKPLLDATVARVSHWIKANKGLIASRAAEYVEGFLKALPEIVKWCERIAFAVGIFWGMALAVKAAETAIIAFQGTIAIIKGVAWAIRAIGAANTFVAVTSIGAQAGIAGMAAPIIAATAMTVALAAAAGAVGYAIGSWLNHKFGISDWLADTLADLTGINDTVNKIGRSKTRGSGSAPAPYVAPAVPTMTSAPGASEFFGAGALAPQVASPQERAAVLFSETNTSSKETVDINVKAAAGTTATMKKPKSPNVRVAHSGAM
jgi:TP901 family phage tail tape measure protein